MRTSERRRPASSFRYSPLIAAFACVFGTQGVLGAEFPVTSSADTITGGTLREAISLVNDACPGPHTITFSGPFTINVSTPLPAITCAGVEINAGANAVAIDGSGMFTGGCGLTANSASTRIVGLEVRNFSYSGLGYGLCGTLEAVGNNVHHNTKGFNLLGGSIIANNQIHDNVYGIYENVGGSTISGNTINLNSSSGIYGPDNMVIANNTVSNNGGTGVYVWDFATITGNTIFDNTSGINAGAGSVIRGNAIHGHSVEGNGIFLYNGGTIGGAGAGEGNIVYNNAVDIYAYAVYGYGGSLNIVNNLVGTPDGASGGTSSYGIEIYNQEAAYAITGNVIGSHSQGSGVAINYATGAGTISGNMIGVNASGTAALPNGSGIELYSLSGALTISDNVISGNSYNGVDMYLAPGVVLNGNRIGTNASGTAPIPNGVAGVWADCSGALSFSGNVISSNGMYGGYFSGVTGSTFSNNQLTNNGDGISLNSVACTWLLTDGLKVAKAATDNSFDGNVIAYNNGDGILVWGGTGNMIRGGSIHSNAGKNINLDFYGGPTPIDVDPADGSGGPNNRQNYPLITAAAEDSGSTVVNFTLSSIASTSFEIDFYGNTEPQLPAAPGGRNYLGRVTVVTDGSGNVTNGVAAFQGSHTHITATATGPFGTSEFSQSIVPLVPAATVSAASLNFGEVVLADSSASQTVTITSSGSGAYTIDSIVTGTVAPSCPGNGLSFCPSGDFICTDGPNTPPNTCAPGTPLTFGMSCTISASFQPMSLGAKSTNIYICDNTSATPRAITLTGTGVPHVVTASQNAHDFGNVSIGTQVASPSILVTNAGTNPPALLGPPTVAAPFSVGSNTCGSSLAAGASCSFTVVYAPTAVGLNTGTFSMTVANGNPVVVDLQGAGISTAVGQLPLPSGIDFGTAVLASAPLQHALTLQNTGNAPVTFSGITVTEPFQMSHNCPASLAPSASCILNLSFAPLVYGNTTGQLVVSSDAGSGNQVVTLLATVAGIGYSLSPWTHAFGAVPVGSTSPPRAIAISNNGVNAIPLSGFSVSGPYTIVSNDCGASLAPASFCTAEVAFAPVAAGPAGGTFTAQVGLTGAPPAVATLSGTGTQQPILVLPGAIDFGAILRGSVPSVSRSLELRNTGNATLTFSTGIDGPFALSGDCGGSLAPGAACTLTITFAPSTVGDFAGSLDIVSNAPGGSGSIPITARVQAQPRPDLRVDASEMGFGDRMIGTRSGSQSVTVSNMGLVAAQLGVLPPTRDFIATSQCGATLAPGASCTVDVVFMPLATGLRYNQLQFTSDAPGSPFGVGLSGRGCSPLRPGRPPSCN